MSFIILEGVDRVGKSTVADIYKAQGYEVVHFTAPDKKYSDKNYIGPSYFDEIIELLLKYDGSNVVFDRSWYGELVWSQVYGRKPLLSEEEIEEIQQWEQRNSTTRMLMIDPNTQAHWQRCVDNKEPLTISQFMQANKLYAHIAHKYNFAIHSLTDFKDVLEKTKANTTNENSDAKQPKAPTAPEREVKAATTSNSPTINRQTNKEESGLEKLEKANAIRDILSKPVLKRKGGAFDLLEEEIKDFLSLKLDALLGLPQTKTNSLSSEDVEILKVFIQRIKEKEVSKK
jgi:thymidylate kinase